MSLLHASARMRPDQTAYRWIPVVLPLVVVRIGHQGVLDVVVDREPYATDAPLERSDLPQLLDTITGDLATPVKVEIREPDGTVFTDIVTPEPAGNNHSKETPRTSLVVPPGEVAGGGFLPDEEVAVAVVVAHQVATADGTARLRLPPALLAGRSGVGQAGPGGTGVVVLLGSTSGTIAVSSGAVSSGGS